jgi:hypothetical protein
MIGQVGSGADERFGGGQAESPTAARRRKLCGARDQRQSPRTQIAAPQQPRSVVQVPPEALQHAVPPRPLLAQVLPPAQHAGGRPVVVHAAPSAMPQAPISIWQVPPPQVRPVQQSASAWQVAPRAWQTQRPAVHAIWPQQPNALVQVAPASAQQSAVRPVARHESPVQQPAIAPAMHALPAAVHATAVQRRAVQALPVQQSAVATHAAPVAAHIVAAWQVPAVHVVPMQHCALVVQAPPEAVHIVAAWQLPRWQVRPVQQSASPEHGEVRPWHAHRPPVQSICPQHSLLFTHTVAASRQHAGVVGSGRHERPVQHCEAPIGHDDPGPVHIAGRHVPDWQLRPVQQSPFAAQRDPLGWQAQRPIAQSISPQHSTLDAQVPPASWQHAAVAGLARHDSPVQHSAAVRHAAAAAEHIPATRPHVPLWHASPAEHWDPVAQHACPSAPHIAARHTPVAQVDPVAQARPHIPQFRASAAVSTHAAPQHVSAPAHAAPIAQHAWPAAPQVAAGRPHVPV